MLPSTVIYTETFDWNGVARVVVTVTEDEPEYPGLYKWNYELTNLSYAEGIRTFALPVEDSAMVDTQQLAYDSNDIDWLGGVGLMGDPDLVTWAGPQNPGGGGGEALDGSLGLSESANFWFTTAPTGVALTNGVITDGTLPSLDVMPAGLLATALDELEQAPVLTVLAATAEDADDPYLGLTSLREAVNKANTEDTTEQQRITFPKGLTNGTITLKPNEGQLTLKKNIYVDGLGKALTIRRDASSPTKYRIFEVKDTSTAKLVGLTLKDGELDQAPGGAVLSNGSLTIEDCTFVQNEAVGSRGGAVAAESGSLTVRWCSFTGNSAKRGGAVHIGERVTTTISDSSFVLNQATDSGQAASAYGGGIHIYSSRTEVATTVTLSGVDLNGNSALTKGGGIYVEHIDAGAGTNLLLIDGTQIRNNLVTQAGGKGGGLYFGRGTLLLGGVSVTDNSAPIGPQAYRVTPGTTVNVAPGSENTYTEVTGGP